MDWNIRNRSCFEFDTKKTHFQTTVENDYESVAARITSLESTLNSMACASLKRITPTYIEVNKMGQTIQTSILLKKLWNHFINGIRNINKLRSTTQYNYSTMMKCIEGRTEQKVNTKLHAFLRKTCWNLEFLLFFNVFENFNKLQTNFNQNGLKIFNSLQLQAFVTYLKCQNAKWTNTLVSFLFASNER